MPEVSRGRLLLASLALSLAGKAALATTPVQPSALDAPLFYQLLLGEMELRNDQSLQAYQIYLDAARRTRDAQLFRRAMDIALQARAWREALEATHGWRDALPDATEPLRLELQILTALNQLDGAARPLTALLAKTPPADRAGLIAALPRVFERAGNKRRTAELLDTALAVYAADADLRTPALVARGRAWLAAGDADRALALARQAAADDPAAPGPALLAMEMRSKHADAEALVRAHLARPDAEPALRLAWSRILTASQRYPEAIAQLESVTAQLPDQSRAWLMLGALQLELKQTDAAEAALKRYVELAERPTASEGEEPVAGGNESSRDASADQGLVQAWLMLAQVAEQRGDFPAAEGWLARIDDPQRALEVQARRAALMARQGNVEGAVASLRQVPERSPTDARAKLVAEAQLLREVKQWQPAYDVFARAVERFPDDVDLLYEQAMMAEKLDRLADMERLLRRVIEIQPHHGHAHNALGYSLADRGLRLTEARELIRKALELMPGDPFITDSLGWVEFRLGNLVEAERLLRQAWTSRPDTEIGAHLGEVLWAQGRQDEARQIWRQAQTRDKANEVLRETLSRLQVGL